MKPVFLIVIVTVAMIGVMVPSVFAESTMDVVSVGSAEISKKSFTAVELEDVTILKLELNVKNLGDSPINHYSNFKNIKDMQLLGDSNGNGYSISSIGDYSEAPDSFSNCPVSTSDWVYDVKLNPNTMTDFVFCYLISKINLDTNYHYNTQHVTAGICDKENGEWVCEDSIATVLNLGVPKIIPKITIPVATNTITIVNESGLSQSCVDLGCYTPIIATVDVGGVVTMTNTDPTGVHTFTSGTVNGFTPSPDGVFDSGVLMSNDAFEWSPTEAGTVPYYCMLHTWMVGEIIVQEAAAAEEVAIPRIEVRFGHSDDTTNDMSPPTEIITYHVGEIIRVYGTVIPLPSIDHVTITFSTQGEKQVTIQSVELYHRMA